MKNTIMLGVLAAILSEQAYSVEFKEHLIAEPVEIVQKAPKPSFSLAEGLLMPYLGRSTYTGIVIDLYKANKEDLTERRVIAQLYTYDRNPPDGVIDYTVLFNNCDEDNVRPFMVYEAANHVIYLDRNNDGVIDKTITDIESIEDRVLDVKIPECIKLFEE